MGRGWGRDGILDVGKGVVVFYVRLGMGGYVFYLWKGSFEFRNWEGWVGVFCGIVWLREKVYEKIYVEGLLGLVLCESNSLIVSFDVLYMWVVEGYGYGDVEYVWKEGCLFL